MTQGKPIRTESDQLLAENLPLVEPLDETLSSVEVCSRLAGLSQLLFFDSALRDTELGRYSFVAVDPFDRIEIPAGDQNALAQLLGKWQRYHSPRIPDLPPFQGGWAGLFGYELGRSLEAIPAALADDLPAPAVALGCYDVVVAFDHHQGTAWIVSQGFPETDQRARLERAHARLAQMKQWLSKDSSLGLQKPSTEVTPIEAIVPQFDIGLEGVTSNMSAETYRRTIRRAIEYIHAGDLYQVNIAQRLLCPARSSALEMYLRLRERNPAPYAAYFDLGIQQICSASPERFLWLQGDSVETRPIKGTRGRWGTSVADLYAADELRTSEKDRAENVMIVDLLRNDLSRVCQPESVHVAQLCGVESYAYVKHLVSIVRGELRPEIGPLDVIAACFPGGSITGAPKVRAMEVIAELEPNCRGAYCGSLGYLGFDGSLDSSILIRTITAGKGWWQLPVGGGIVSQSDPDAEYQETWHKARGLLRVLE